MRAAELQFLRALILSFACPRRAPSCRQGAVAALKWLASSPTRPKLSPSASFGRCERARSPPHPRLTLGQAPPSLAS